MKGLTFIISLLLLAFAGQAQCKYVWLPDKSFPQGIPCYTQQMVSSDIVPGNCTQIFRKKCLDSIIEDIRLNPLVYKRGKNFPGEPSDFRTYFCDTFVIVRYKSKEYIFEKDTIVIHDFSFSLPEREWNIDGCYHFLYTPGWGILARDWFIMQTVDRLYLKSNSCFTESQNQKLKKLIELIKQDPM